MKPYSDYIPYDAEAFLMDQAFRDWIANPTPEMTAYWQGLLDHHPHLARPFEQAQLLAQGLEATWVPFSQTYIDDQYKKTLSKLAEEPAESPLPDRLPRSVSFWKYAAAVLIPLLVGSWTYMHYFREQQIRTGNAQLLTFTLYDGSQIKLNANSQLRVPSRYEWGRQRQVWLSGEGFFAVEKKRDSRTGDKIKFTVHTRRGDVVVLGTRFTVYDRMQHTRVLLEEGRIALTDPTANKMFIMKPGQLASFRQGDKTFSLSHANASEIVALTDWRSNALVFKNAPMPELKQRFQEVYGMELMLDGDDFTGQNFTGELPHGDLEKALTILSETFGLKAVPYQDKVYFVSGR